MAKLEKMGEWLNVLMSKRMDALVGVGSSLFFIVLGSYLLASTLGTVFIGLLGDDAVRATGSVLMSSRTVQGIKKRLNYRDLRKSVLGRNVFNSEGELPDERAPEREDEGQGETAFNPDAPCTKTTLGIQLIGTIFMGRDSPRSLATIKEKEYTDIYRVGDPIVDNPQASIYAIGPRFVEINNAGIKECLKLEVSAKVQKIAAVTKAPVAGPPDTETAGEGEGKKVVLEHKYVTDALGTGYAEILKKGRMVPFHRDNRMLGYKLIGVKGGSLYSKIGLGSGDVITNVNGISMSQADQGFALYNALAEEKEIRVEILKKGNEPTTITVEIR